MKYILCLTIILALLSFHSPYINASARHPQSAAEFEKSAGWGKIDLRMRTAWREAMDSGNKDTKFECILKATKPVGKEENSILKGAGFKSRLIIGQIVTGSLAAKKIPAVANLEIVEALELAAPMHIKKN